MLTVYIADDEIWIAIGLKKIIEKSKLPYQIIGEASDGLTALEDIRRLKPDILLTDIRMPGLSGLELLDHIKKDPRLSVQVILISGYAEFEYARTAMRKGACDYLLKPVNPEDLYNALQKASQARSARHGKNQAPAPQDEEPAISQSLVSSILEEIQKHFTEDISLTELSEKYNVSASHLSSLFKRELGISFSEYITSKRMQKARSLLQNEALSIEEVANAAGYHDYFYFTKVFKKTFGISPSKYRKELKKKQEQAGG